MKKREVLVCSDDPFDDGIPDLVINHPVVCAADEELVLMESREKKGRTSIHSHSRHSVFVFTSRAHCCSTSM